MRSEDAAIGALVREYAENERKIAALLSHLDTIGKGLRLLGDALAHNPQQIELTSQEFRFGSLGQRRGVPDTVIQVAVIRECLSELQTSLEDKRRMESRLEQANMENLIKGEKPLLSG